MNAHKKSPRLEGARPGELSEGIVPVRLLRSSLGGLHRSPDFICRPENCRAQDSQPRRFGRVVHASEVISRLMEIYGLSDESRTECTRD